MNRRRRVMRSFATALGIAAAIQCLTVGVLAPRLPREVLRPAVVRTVERSFPAAKRVRLHNEDGGVQISTSEGDAIAVSANVRAYTVGTAAELTQKYVDSLVDTAVIADLVNIVSEPGVRPEEIEELRVDYTLTVPVGTDVRIDGADGNVVVNPGCGRIEVNGNNSDVTVYEPRGPVRVHSVNGRIRVYEARSETAAETVNGSIYAYMRAGALTASTTNGAIVATVYSDEVRACDLTSLNGGITLLMSSGCSAEVQAASERGTVRSDLTVASPAGGIRRDALRGTIGKGQIRLAMKSLNGNIVLTRSET